MYHFVYLGIPSEVFDDIERNKALISGGKNAHAYFIRQDKRDSGYNHRDLTAVFKIINQEIASEKDRDVGKSKFAIFYISREESDNIIKEGLFPFMYTVPVTWNIDLDNSRSRKESKNDLVKILTDISLRARWALDLVERKLKEDMQRTPWLLPIKNFRSRYLVPHMLDLQRSLIEAESEVECFRLLEKIDNRFKDSHPPQAGNTGRYQGRKFFVDETKLQFVPPGLDLHGFSRTAEGHNAACAISGRRRLGVPYNPSFHYDCTFDGGATEADLCNCHRKTASRIVSKKNINIATNDYIRPDSPIKNGK